MIEDDVDVRRVLAMGLEAYGSLHQVLESGDGENGWVMVQQEKPDLVLLDLMLPGLGGEVVLGMIKKHHDLKGTKVIIVSAKGTEEDVQRGRQLGADGYLVKPFRLDELRQAIRNVMGEEALPSIRKDEAFL